MTKHHLVYFTSWLLSLCSRKDTSIQTWARWCFGTLVHHLLGPLAFWIMSLFLPPTTCLSVYWLVVLTPWKESYDQPRQSIKKLRHYFVYKGPSSQGCVFSSSHVWMWELDCKESWAPKNWCFWAVVLEKTLESPLDCKESQPVHPKGDQSWVFIGRTDVEA